MKPSDAKADFCGKCGLDRRVEGVSGGVDGNESTYTVVWRCPKCLEATADICPIGPLIPEESSCLNCGHGYEQQNGNLVCAACGLPKSESTSFLGIDPNTDPMGRAKALLQRGNIRSGIGHLNYKLLKDPRHEEAWVQKCSVLGDLKFFSSILQALKSAFPQGVTGELLFSQAFALQGTSKHQEAIAVYEQYITFNKAPDCHAIALGNLANSKKALGDFGGAEDVYKQALKSEAAVSAVYCNYSRLLIDQGRWNEALNVTAEGLRRHPKDPLAAQLHADQAYIHAEQNRGEESIVAARAAMALDGQSLRNNYLFGRALALVGRLQDAREQILKVLAMDPNNQDGQRALAMLDQAIGKRNTKRWWEFWK